MDVSEFYWSLKSVQPLKYREDDPIRCCKCL